MARSQELGFSDAGRRATSLPVIHQSGPEAVLPFPPLQELLSLGIAEVRDVFKAPKIGAVAGCMVVEGTVHRHKKIRVLRENVVIYEGELESLRRFKDDVNEVRNGMECGIGVKNYNDVQVGDKIEVFDQVKVERSL